MLGFSCRPCPHLSLKFMQASTFVLSLLTCECVTSWKGVSWRDCVGYLRERKTWSAELCGRPSSRSSSVRDSPINMTITTSQQMVPNALRRVAKDGPAWDIVRKRISS